MRFGIWYLCDYIHIHSLNKQLHIKGIAIVLHSFVVFFLYGPSVREKASGMRFLIVFRISFHCCQNECQLGSKCNEFVDCLRAVWKLGWCCPIPNFQICSVVKVGNDWMNIWIYIFKIFLPERIMLNINLLFCLVLLFKKKCKILSMTDLMFYDYFCRVLYTKKPIWLRDCLE